MVRYLERIIDRTALDVLNERQRLLSSTQLFSASYQKTFTMGRTNWVLDATPSVKRKQISDISVEGVEKRILPSNGKKFYVSTIWTSSHVSMVRQHSLWLTNSTKGFLASVEVIKIKTEVIFFSSRQYFRYFNETLYQTRIFFQLLGCTLPSKRNAILASVEFLTPR